MKNLDIRRAISDAQVKQWQVAEAIGICERTLCVWLRKELSAERRRLIVDAIERIKREVSR